jgi:NADP-dependent alcohol dehydrogenase
VYEQVKAALAKHRVVEFGGIEPNPLYETCCAAIDLARREQVGFVLAVGGGSVLDGAKLIAAGAVYTAGEPWDIVRTTGAAVTAALPLGTVLTLPATGSEANGNSVISRKATGEKLHFTSAHVYPVFSVLDPATTMSLPAKQVRNGIVDAYVHVCEQYLTRPAAAPLQDRLAESVLQTLIEVGPAALAKPQDYDARASLMWSATIALNNLLGCGVPQDWATHMIGHEVTAFYGLDHAETLAVVMPGVWRHKFAAKQAKLAQYGRRVFGVDGAEAAIERTEGFFAAIGMPTRFAAYRIDANEAATRIAARFAERKVAFGEDGDIGPDATATILRSRA